MALKPGDSNKKLVIGAHYDSVATKGVEDNGTGMSLLLELAKRFKDTETPLTLEFCFFDGEETQDKAGSYFYLANTEMSDILCYINLDSLGAGDIMYVYGGDYEDGELVRDWGYNMAVYEAEVLGIRLSSLPKEVGDPKTPTRPKNSDHLYFNLNGIPYVYFEANRWIREDGTLGNTDIIHFYNSALPEFAETNGQIIHTEKFEDLATLERLVPGRIKAHLTAFSKVVSQMIRDMTERSPEIFVYPIEVEKPSESESETEPSEKETETETPEPDTEEPETSSETAEPDTKPSETVIPTTPSEESTPEETEEAETETEEESSPETSDTEKEAEEVKPSGQQQETEKLSPERKRKLAIFLTAAGALTIILIGAAASCMKNWR